MAAIAEKRRQSRLIMDDSFNIHHKGNRCRVVDISGTGLGVTFIGGEDWPKNLTLEYSLSSEAEQVKSIKCRTVWESSMDFYKARSEEKVRRRGLEFMEPGSGEVAELRDHLTKIAQVDQ